MQHLPQTHLYEEVEWAGQQSALSSLAYPKKVEKMDRTAPYTFSMTLNRSTSFLISYGKSIVIIPPKSEANGCEKS